MTRVFRLKRRIAVCLSGLYDVMPKYTSEDLVVAHRQNSKGVWRDELWTNRNFAPHELMLAPLTSQLKDTHLTALANALVGLPRIGRGSHPEGQSLALDGRSRVLLAPAGAIDGNPHGGSLFWLVGRASQASEGNMSLENFCCSQTLEFTAPFKLPNKKRKVPVEWQQAEFPNLPVLSNKKAIKQHTRLMLFQAATEVKSADGKSK